MALSFGEELRSYLKIGFWSKIAAAVRFKPEEYYSISKI